MSGSVKNDNSIVMFVEYKPNGLCIERNDLSSNIEEADACIIRCINDALSSEFTHFIIKSNDTDGYKLLLHYAIHFKERELKELMASIWNLK